MSEKNNSKNRNYQNKLKGNSKSNDKNCKQNNTFQKEQGNNNKNNKIASHTLKERKSEGAKKTIEFKNKDDQVDKLKVTKLDD